MLKQFRLGSDDAERESNNFLLILSLFDWLKDKDNNKNKCENSAQRNVDFFYILNLIDKLENNYKDDDNKNCSNNINNNSNNNDNDDDNKKYENNAQRNVFLVLSHNCYQLPAN